MNLSDRANAKCSMSLDSRFEGKEGSYHFEACELVIPLLDKMGIPFFERKVNDNGKSGSATRRREINLTTSHKVEITWGHIV